MRNLITAVLLSVLLSSIEALSMMTVSPVHAAALVDVSQNEVVINFPETATFKLEVTGASEIHSVVLEYGNEQQTCGEVIAKAYPQFTPGTSVSTEWTWEMRQSGSLPPGSQLWWRWHVTDSEGKETVTDKKTATWLDDVHKWKTLSKGNINFHWYSGDDAFAQDLLNAAQNGLKFNETQSGLTTKDPIDLYIYANTDDMKDAMLYEPSWTGGSAYPKQNIVIIGVSKDELEWGRDAIVHELTHVLVGHLTFSCLGDVPTWLNEGLAVYSEGELDSYSQDQLDTAIKDDMLLTVRSLSAGFSEVPDKAYLSYSQSYSVVKFLVETYGQEKMTALLTLLRDGRTTDDALQQTYGFNIDGLEDAWRAAIGAKPRTVSAQPTAQPTPTFVPTIVPISGGSYNGQAAGTPIPTSSLGGQPTVMPTTQRGGPPLWLTLTLLTFCCLLLLIVGVIVLGFIVRSQNKKGGKHG